MTPRPIVLIGLPAVGKSSVGLAVADRLGRPFVELDAEIESRAGRPTGEIVDADGEARLRELEHRALADVLDRNDGSVIAAGSAIVVTEANRRRLAEGPAVVWLDAPLGDTAARLDALRWERFGLYTSCADAIVADDGTADVGRLAERVVDELAAVDPPGHLRIETVDFGDDRSYPVVVGRRAIDRLASLIPAGVRRVAVVTQPAIGIDVDPGVEHLVFEVPDGESAKRLEVVGDLASRFARWGLTRRDAVVSVGGGVVSDLAGYVAASYHRGVPVVHVSTTLLGQIDAAIGGKCGVNLPEGKNLLGAFKQPAAVICDTATLASLPPAEFASGMGELAKYHFLGGGRLDRLPLGPRVAACVRIKADVVVSDEREGGRRATLNYGHTLAHALEIATDYRLRHGEAVAIGLVYAAELAAALGRIDADRVAEHRRVAAAYGLSTTLPGGLDGDELVELFARDKKAVDGITFVLDGPDGIEPVVVGDRGLLRATLETLT